MTRPSVTEAAARRRPNVRASSSDSDPLHSRVKARSGDARSPRGGGGQSNASSLGTRIADLESQLILAQEELKCIKDQLVSTDTSKKVAHDQLDKNPQHKSSVIIEEKTLISSIGEQIPENDGVVDGDSETDVFEVSIEKVAVESKSELKLVPSIDEFPPEIVAVELEPENPLIHELELKNDEINMLKASVIDKDKEMEVVLGENESLKRQLDEKSHNLSSAQSEVAELTSRLDKIVQELEEHKSNAAQIEDKVQAAEKVKADLQDEMMKLRVQSEQWRKAADAAASVLAGGVELHGRRISERCGSMDTSLFERVGGFTSYVGSPGLHDDPDYAFGSQKQRKGGSGIKMLGELWRKKGHK